MPPNCGDFAVHEKGHGAAVERKSVFLGLWDNFQQPLGCPLEWEERSSWPLSGDGAPVGLRVDDPTASLDDVSAWLSAHPEVVHVELRRVDWSSGTLALEGQHCPAWWTLWCVPPAVLETMLLADWMETVRGLCLERCELEGSCALPSGTQLGALEDLQVRGGRWSLSWTRALQAALPLTLERLAWLECTDLDTLDAFLEHLPSAHCYSFARCRLDGPRLEWIAQRSQGAFGIDLGHTGVGAAQAIEHLSRPQGWSWLGVAGLGFSAEDVRALAAAPERLQGICVDAGDWAPEALGALLLAQGEPVLERLWAEGARGVDGWLSQAAALPSLRRLDLAGSDLTGVGWTALGQGLAPGLQWLDASTCALSGAAASGPLSFPALIALDVSFASFGVTPVEHFFYEGALPSLRVLSAVNHTMAPQGTADFEGWARSARVQEVELVHGASWGELAWGRARAALSSSVRVLRCAGPGASAQQWLKAMLQRPWPRLRRLALDEVVLEVQDVQTLMKVAEMGALRVLSCAFADLEALDVFLEWPVLAQLTELRLGLHGLDEDDGDFVAELVAECRWLESAAQVSLEW